MPKLSLQKAKSQNSKPKSPTELKALVHNFDFSNPDFSNIPNFPNISNRGLTKYESGLLTAIKLAYLNSDQGRKHARNRLFKTVGTMGISIAIIAFIQLTITSPAVNVVKSVAAATVSAILR